MISILIADDEDLIRKGIIAILKNAFHSGVAYLEAENGLEAMKICKEQYPQIIVSDIRMPFCNGLKFIERVRALGYSPVFIIVSGYSDFEYAKQAIQYGVKDYILKPIQKEQFVGLIRSCIEEITEKKDAMRCEHISTQSNTKTVKAVKKKILIDLLNCNDENNIRKIDNIRDYRIEPESNFALCCVVQYKVDQNNVDYIDLAIINILEEILERENLLRGTIIETYSEGQIVLVFEGCSTQATLNMIASAIAKAFQPIRIYLKIDVFAGIGDIQFGPTRLYKSFHHACEAADYKIYRPGNSIRKYEQSSSGKEEIIQFNTLLHGLDNLDPLKIAGLFQPLAEKEPSVAAAYAVEKSYLNLIGTIREPLAKYCFAEADLPIPTPFCNYWNFLQLKQGVENYILQVKALIDGSNAADGSGGKLIRDIFQYVKDNAAGDINLNTVAARFSYTPSYISSLFKKHFGIGFNEFLTKSRMEMAKDMLKTSDIPISEISGRCGYGNSKYFAASFKKSFGVSPSAFRQN